MNYRRAGKGSPLVLIHGIGSRWQVWSPLLDELAASFDVTAVDLPGFGESPVDPGADLADLLRSLGIERPVVGGSSMGGGIALDLARRGIARAVVAFSPVGFFGDAGARWCRGVVGAARAGAVALDPLLPRIMSTRVGRGLLCGAFHGHPVRLDPVECVADARALARAPGFGAARRRLGEWRADASLAAELAGVPVTIAWGTRDLVLPPYRQAARARALLPNARHVRLAGCGHLPFADDPRTCARLLRESA